MSEAIDATRRWTLEELGLDPAELLGRARRWLNYAKACWDSEDERWVAMRQAFCLMRREDGLNADEVIVVLDWGMTAPRDHAVLMHNDEFPAPVVRSAESRWDRYREVAHRVKGWGEYVPPRPDEQDGPRWWEQP